MQVWGEVIALQSTPLEGTGEVVGILTGGEAVGATTGAGVSTLEHCPKQISMSANPLPVVVLIVFTVTVTVS